MLTTLRPARGEGDGEEQRQPKPTAAWGAEHRFPLHLPLGAAQP